MNCPVRFSNMLFFILILACVDVRASRTTSQMVDYVKQRLVWYAHESTPPDNIDLNDPLCVEELREYSQWESRVKNLQLVFSPQGAETNDFTFAENRAAFDYFLTTLATNDCQRGVSHLTSADEMRSLWAEEDAYRGLFMLLKDIGYTNACPHLRGLALNPRGIMRVDAIKLAVQLGAVDSEATGFVENIITNSADCLGWRERGYAYSEYAKKVHSCSNRNDVCEHAAEMFYRNRWMDWRIAPSCDTVLSSVIDGYAQSSNRLEYANWVLRSTQGLGWGAYSRFVSITNQLLSSGQPLRQLTIGEGGNE